MLLRTRRVIGRTRLIAPESRDYQAIYVRQSISALRPAAHRVTSHRIVWALRPVPAPRNSRCPDI